MRVISNIPASVRLCRLLTVLSATLVFAGCANIPSAAPSVTATTGSTGVQLTLAQDTIRQLLALYPPANTRFNIAQQATDAFGTALVTGLREKGYAVMESSAVSSVNQPSTFGEAARQPKPASAGLALQYLIDNPGTDNLYRVSLVIGNGNLSRAYLAENEDVKAAGAWARKE